MGTLLRDIRYAIRTLRRRRGFVSVVVVSLALGIGANTAVFTVVNGVLLRPLPYPEPERLVRLFETVNRSSMASDRMEVAPANFLDWQAQAESFTDIAAYGSGNVPLANAGNADGNAEVVPAAFVNYNLFSALDVKPLLGREFTADEDTPANEFVAILSYGLWQRRFGADEGVIGSTVSLDGHTYKLIGVMPPDFQFPSQTQLWTPLALNERQVKMREARFLKVIGRVKPGVSIAQARAEIDTIAGRLAESFPQTNQNWGAKIAPLLEDEIGKLRPALLMLLGIVALVLLIACANVANLLMARSASRHTEISIRLAVGASRPRIVRQLLTESLILALMGGAAGLLLATWGVDALVALAPQQLPRVGEVKLDGTVLGFTFTVSLATGIVFGLLPALQASKVDLHTSLKQGGSRTAGDLQRKRVLSFLVIAEVALALIVLGGAGLLINSFLRVQRVDSGLNADNVLTVKFTPPSAVYNDRDRWRENRLNFFNQLVPRVSALPGVESVSAIDSIPLSGSARVYRFRKEGDPDTNSNPAATYEVVMVDYFRTVGMRMLRGRDFGVDDREGATPTVIVNDTMARRFWPGEEAIGKRIFIRNETSPREIVGVVSDVKHFALDRETSPVMYLPFNQAVIDLIPMVIRTRGNPLGIAGAVRDEVRAVDPSVAIAKIETMPQIASASIAQRRFTVVLLTVFACIALVLAAIGIYGVMAYSVTQRTREIGVRVALGAESGDILRLILGCGVRLGLFGIVIGLLCAFVLTKLLSSVLSGLIFGIGATDPLTLALIALLLGVVTVAACYLPARKASKVDPIVALRYE